MSAADEGHIEASTTSNRLASFAILVSDVFCFFNREFDMYCETHTLGIVIVGFEYIDRRNDL